MAGQEEQRKIELLVNGTKANDSVKQMETRVALLTNQWKKTTRGTDEFVNLYVVRMPGLLISAIMPYWPL